MHDRWDNIQGKGRAGCRMKDEMENCFRKSENLPIPDNLTSELEDVHVHLD